MNKKRSLTDEAVLGIEVGQDMVTRRLFNLIMGWDRSCFKDSLENPVENVTWYDCLFFCNKLSLIVGFEPCFDFRDIKKNANNVVYEVSVGWNRKANGFRLLTNQEWILCAEADSEFVFSGSDDPDLVAWYKDNSNGKTQPVGLKKPNKWGFYDMSGNAAEWCMDPWFDFQNNLRISRGGSFASDLTELSLNHVLNKSFLNETFRSNRLGFRICRTVK